MCLTTVKRGNPRAGDMKLEGVGWKIYYKDPTLLKPQLEPCYRRNQYSNEKPGKGKITSDHRVKKSDLEMLLSHVGSSPYRYKQYTAGYHVFADRVAAENRISDMDDTSVLCRVTWRGLCAIGIETNDEVLVVKEILTRREVRKAK